MTVMYGAIFLIVYLGAAVLGLGRDTIVHFVIGAVFLGGPVGFVVGAARQVAVGAASLRHLRQAGLDRDGDDAGPPSSIADPFADWERIRMHGIQYRYVDADGPRPTVGPVDLEFRRGEMVFIVGGNGSGKSTLLLLLTSLLAPQDGALLVDDVSVAADLRAYRGRFTGVFGDFFLFPHVLDADGRALPDERVAQLLDVLDLAAHVGSLDGELSRLALSTGQRKRLALLQCYAEDRDIFFFDEWAADQDVHFRDYFYRTLLPALKSRGKTVVAISHDDRYFAVADRVITLESGQVMSDVRTAQASSPARLAGAADGGRAVG